MAKPTSSGDEPDDPLALFGAESDRPGRNTGPDGGRRASQPSPKPPAADPVETPASETTNVVYPTADAFTRILATKSEPAYPPTRDLGVEFVGPPPPKGSVSFDHVCALKGLGFVEGVALIQAAAEAVDASGSGVPELHGLFLTRTGEVVAHGAPTGEPPARELTRLLHQLVAPNLMPPAGRLFVGRWINSDANSLAEFTSELAYFARPNGREILVGLHSRCDAVRASFPEGQPPRPRQDARPKPPTEQEPASKAPIPIVAWIAAHKRALATGLALIVVAVSLTAAATLLMAPGTLEASKQSTPAEADGDLADGATPGVSDSKGARARNAKNGGGSRSAGPDRRATAAAPLTRRRTVTSQLPPSPLKSQDAAALLAEASAEPPAALLARTVPDLRIYSASDTGVEPPRLRSAEIPELLIAGFEKRTNEVELVISEKGDVQQARMIKAPQRMPDIMLLSRAKELRFDPAVRDGVPVRYRLVLSWNVTP